MSMLLVLHKGGVIVLLVFSSLFSSCPYTWAFSPLFQRNSNVQSPSASMTTTLDAATDMNQLVDRALACLEEKRKEDSNAQVFIGVGGAPGSGKSTVMSKVVKGINTALKTQAAILLPMDGYHFSRDRMQEMAREGIAPKGYAEINGTPPSLDDFLRRKGAPWTIDANQLIQDLRNAQKHRCGSFPLYDRTLHDPVKDQLHVTPHHSIVVCEGLYTLALDHEVWKPLGEIWDDRWFMDVPKSELKERLIQRHLKNWNETKIQEWGEGRAGATAKVEDSDYRNADWVIDHSSRHALLLIRND